MLNTASKKENNMNKELEELRKRNEPMKVEQPNNHHWHCYFYYCPKCKELHIKHFHNYCPMCGQALDWNDEQ